VCDILVFAAAFCSLLLSFNTCVICTRNCGSWFLYLLSAVCYLSFWVTGSMSMSMGSKGQGHLSSFIFSIHVLLSRFTAMDCVAEGSRRTESRYLRRIRFSSRMVFVNTFTGNSLRLHRDVLSTWLLSTWIICCPISSNLCCPVVSLLPSHEKSYSVRSE
jgi:hypothetical protein